MEEARSPMGLTGRLGFLPAVGSQSCGRTEVNAHLPPRLLICLGDVGGSRGKRREGRAVGIAGGGDCRAAREGPPFRTAGLREPGLGPTREPAAAHA